MDPPTVAEMLRQIRDGADIPAPSALLRNIKPEAAAECPPDSPYSILTNLAHANFWQRLWLDRLQGKKARSFTEDWQTPNASEWLEIRRRFLEDLDEAIKIAESEPFQHKLRSDDQAVRTLIQIAIHNSYHLGQINLMKRQSRLRRIRSGSSTNLKAP